MTNGLTVLKEGSDERILALLPFVGGSASSFTSFSKALKTDRKVYGITPPGRQGVAGDPLDSVGVMAQTYLDWLRIREGQSIVLFGYSLGAVVAYKMAQLLEIEWTRSVDCLIVMASNSPDHRLKTSHLNDYMFIEFVARLGGIPMELLEEPAIKKQFMKIWRSDFLALETAELGDEKVRCPAFVVSMNQDCIVNHEESNNWDAKFESDVTHMTIQGGHMAIMSNYVDIAKMVDRILMSIDEVALIS